MRPQSDAVCIGDPYAFGYNVINHSRKLVDRKDGEMVMFIDDCFAKQIHAIRQNRARRRPSHIGKQVEYAIKIARVGPSLTFRKQMKAQINVLSAIRWSVEIFYFNFDIVGIYQANPVRQAAALSWLIRPWKPDIQRLSRLRICISMPPALHPLSPSIFETHNPAERLTALLQRADHIINDGIRLGAHLIVRGILNRMGHKHALRIQHSQCFRLGLRCINKLC